MRIASFFRLRVFQRDPVSEEKVSTHVLYIPYHTLRYDTELLIFSLILIIIISTIGTKNNVPQPFACFVVVLQISVSCNGRNAVEKKRSVSSWCFLNFIIPCMLLYSTGEPRNITENKGGI